MLKFEKFYNIKVGDGIFVSNRAEGSLRITRAGYFEGSFGGIAPEGRIIADGNEYPLSVMYNPAISRLPENPGSHCLFYVEGQYIVDGVPIDETGVIPGLYCVIDQFYSSELGLDSDSVYVLLADGSTRFLPLSPSFELPLPSDQIAGKVFSYGFDGDRLILRSSTPPPGGKHLKLALKGNGGRFSATSMSVTLDGIPYYISQDSYIFAYVNNNSAFERRQWKVLSPSEIADGLTFGGAVDLIYREKNGRAEIVYINIGEVTL